MAPLKASRTLLKSSPELWAECSDAASLARHLGAFGEIRITQLEPETAVAWEGEDVRGTVTLEPSGWGTRVILTASPAPGRESGPPAEDALALAPTPAPVQEPESETGVAAPDPEPAAEARTPGFFARLFGRRPRPEPAAETPVAAEPEASAEPEANEPESSTPEPTASEVSAGPSPALTGEPGSKGPAQALAVALESLGKAHRRPFSHG